MRIFEGKEAEALIAYLGTLKGEKGYDTNSKLMSPAAKQAPAVMQSQYERLKPPGRAVGGPPSSKRDGTGKRMRATTNAAKASKEEMRSSAYPVRKSASGAGPERSPAGRL